MNVRTKSSIGMGLVAMGLLVSSTTALAGGITVFNNLGSYEAAIGAATQTVETFTDSFHFPITSGILNSSTAEAGLTAGDIQPGVTYSTPVGTSLFFNIDAGGGYEGGFLDGFFGGDPNRKLTVTFDNTTGAFGFDTTTLAGRTLNVLINFASGDPFSYTSAVTAEGNGDFDFFGFQSSSQDITSVVIDSDIDDTFAFALDNFRFTDASGGGGGQVPEPAGLGILALGLLLAARRLQRN